MGNAKRGLKQIIVPEVWTSEGRHERVIVPLDPRRDPKDNLERLFSRARKLERSKSTLETRLLVLKGRLGRFSQFEKRLKEATDLKSIQALHEAVVLAGLAKAPPPKAPQGNKPRKRKDKRFRHFLSSDGITILVGRNNKENDALVKERTRPKDLWLHAKNSPGAHVVVRMPDGLKDCPENTLLEAAKIALHFSKQRFAGKAEVMIAKGRALRKPSGAPAGQVIVDSYRSLRTKTDPEIIDRLTLS